ncbi:signal transduction histidine kinase [Amycolatopsis bartoniae]|uniref:histidine kinase n=1 Tax=Amycolatopsis bartoniae TaxID=941986 RepID=A0A8H9IU49_9PSEU|nr:histidine kinase [Amycolatopsis bartoniae]MBB2937185.1 signal transduction histidine kinase [Amycolatopsis bartoniae]GHF53080.1 hypothetical protein GCM10017566_28080 [Amycolatopsis bartoniae]
MDDGRRVARYTDELLRPFGFAVLVAVTAVQFATRPVTAPALSVPLFAAVSLLTLGGLLPWTRLPAGGRVALAAAFAVLTAVLLPLAQATLAPAFAFVATAVAGEKLGRRAAGFVAAAGAVATAVAVWAAGELHPTADDWPWWLALTVAAPVFAGIARRDRQAAVLNARRALRSEAREAALRERARIAREIHDVLGHSLSGIALQLDMADALHGKGRDDEANQATRRARALAVSSITETRRAIEALRADALPLDRGLRLLAEGEDVPFEISGDPAPVPTETAHALLRAAQEALTNAAKHAPGAERSMALAFPAGAVTLTVRNGPRAGEADPQVAAGGGMGLVGMRERIALLGGSLRAGPAAGGWRVEVEVPR